MENTILSGVHQAIGNTPMVHLSRLTENLDGNIFAKLEYLNPGFSKKDRIALQTNFITLAIFMLMNFTRGKKFGNKRMEK
ncbi:pyridoxal-phosphate dependent enzyme [Brevibacillus fortis]|uniref:pyridoxal-phosphate dependent enzyme n=1 Tax=Brevibacillus fortis TaxID=2126352 RepID=UPI0038FCCBAE